MPNITIKSDKPLILISVEEYENMKETLELLALYPKLLDELKEERVRMDKGDFITLKDCKKKYKP